MVAHYRDIGRLDAFVALIERLPELDIFPARHFMTPQEKLRRAEQAKAGQCGNVTCTQAQIDAGTCPVYCPTGACLPRMMGDDAFSRFGVAKEAIYEIARQSRWPGP